MTSNYQPPTGRRRLAARIAAWTAVATIGALAVTGIALAAPAITGAANSAPNPAPSATGSANPDKPPTRGERGDKGKRHGPLARLGRAVHGEAVVRGKDGKFVTVFTQRGEVTAVSATSITLKSADGFTSKYAVNAETRVMKDRKPANIADVKVGDQAGVIATKSGDVKNARGIAVGKGPHPKTDD